MAGRLIALALVALVCFTGCLGGLPFGHSGGFTREWTSATPAHPGGTHHPAAVARFGGGTYVAAGLGATGTNRTCSFTVLNGSGGVRWSKQIERDACGTQPASDPAFGDVTGDGTPEVVWATREARLYAADPSTGRLAMNVSLPSGMVFVRPVVLSDPTLVVLPMMNGHVRAYWSNGSLAWNRTFHHHIRGQEPTVVTTANGTRELLVGTDGGLVALDPATGATRWRNHAPTRFLRVGRATGTLVVVTAGLNAAGLNGTDGYSHVAAYAANGTRLWRHGHPGSATVGAVGSVGPNGTAMAFATDDRGHLTAYDAATGRLAWNRTLEVDPHYVPPPALADLNGGGSRRLVATTGYGPMRVFDPANGTQTASWQWSNRSVAVWAGLRSADLDGDGRQSIVAVNTNARVVAVGNETNHY